MRPAHQMLDRAVRAPKKHQGPWNTLEVCKLLMSTVTAAAIAYAGWQVNRTSAEQAAQRVRQKKVFDRRADTWAQVAHSLTQLHQVQEIIQSQNFGSLGVNNMLQKEEAKEYEQFLFKSELAEDASPFFSKQTILCMVAFGDASTFFHADIEDHAGEPGWRKELNRHYSLANEFNRSLMINARLDLGVPVGTSNNEKAVQYEECRPIFSVVATFPEVRSQNELGHQ